jgi:hypothetical protein
MSDEEESAEMERLAREIIAEMRRDFIMVLLQTWPGLVAAEDRELQHLVDVWLGPPDRKSPWCGK